jgi:hypothetical protein
MKWTGHVARMGEKRKKEEDKREETTRKTKK